MIDPTLQSNKQKYSFFSFSVIPKTFFSIFIRNFRLCVGYINLNARIISAKLKALNSWHKINTLLFVNMTHKENKAHKTICQHFSLRECANVGHADVVKWCRLLRFGEWTQQSLWKSATNVSLFNWRHGRSRWHHNRRLNYLLLMNTLWKRASVASAVLVAAVAPAMFTHMPQDGYRARLPTVPAATK